MKRKLLFIMVIMLVVTACAPTETSAGVKTEVLEVTSTLVPTVTSTPQPTPTSTLTPTPTLRPTSTATPTETPIPMPTDDGRVWDTQALYEFLMFVGSHIVVDPYYEEVDERVLEAYPDYLQCLNDYKTYCPEGETDAFWLAKKFAEANIPPSYWCAWVDENLGKGVGWHDRLPGATEIVETFTREGWIESLNITLGNPNREPYCPQFDPSLAAED